MLASSGGKERIVSVLLEEGADPNLKKLSGVTALFLASAGGHTPVLSLLLAAGAQPDPLSQEGGTPLMAAAQAGHLQAVETLLRSGAEPSTAMWDGATALFLAAQNGHTAVVSLLLSRPGLGVDQQRRDGATPLWIAAQAGREDCVRLLLQHGAKVDLARSDGATPLFKACHKGHESVVREIMKYNPRLGTLQVWPHTSLALLTPFTQNGWTCLHAAALSGHSNLVLTLVEAGADPNLVNMSGFTALDVALGAARKTLVTLTTRISSHSGDLQTRPSCSPERLSALRSGAAVLLRSGLTGRAHTPPPLTAPHLSPGRRVKSASTCPSTPCRSPKHSVTFNDPLLYKNGGLVTKVSRAMPTNQLVPIIKFRFSAELWTGRMFYTQTRHGLRPTDH